MMSSRFAVKNPNHATGASGMGRRLHGAIQIDQLTLQNASMRVIHFLLQSRPTTPPALMSLNGRHPSKSSRPDCRYDQKLSRAYCNSQAEKIWLRYKGKRWKCWMLKLCSGNGRWGIKAISNQTENVSTEE